MVQQKKMDTFREYLDDFFNLLDISYVVITGIHLIFRLIYINGTITTQWSKMNKLDVDAQDDEFTDLDALLLVVNFATLIVSSFKVLALLRMFK